MTTLIVLLLVGLLLWPWPPRAVGRVRTVQTTCTCAAAGFTWSCRVVTTATGTRYSCR